MDSLIVFKNCPHCNSEEEYMTVKETYRGSYVQCKFCKMCGPEQTNVAMAIKYWNLLPRDKENESNS